MGNDNSSKIGAAYSADRRRQRARVLLVAGVAAGARWNSCPGIAPGQTRVPGVQAPGQVSQSNDRSPYSAPAASTGAGAVHIRRRSAAAGERVQEMPRGVSPREPAAVLRPSTAGDGGAVGLIPPGQKTNLRLWSYTRVGPGHSGNFPARTQRRRRPRPRTVVYLALDGL